ncbi:MAG: membrane protein insertion efficiency factor YidD [Rhodospirillales bacterium]|nr:membrane protein insertion efficiency factor YidD [Rhodospirillales bacterium]
MIDKFFVRIAQIPVRLYRFFLSPWIGNQCRFYPTCSAYMLEAMEKHGAAKGLYLGIRRILACNPWNKYHGHDPVPERFTWGDMLGYKRKQHPHPCHEKADNKESTL